MHTRFKLHDGSPNPFVNGSAPNRLSGTPSHGLTATRLRALRRGDYQNEWMVDHFCNEFNDRRNLG